MIEPNWFATSGIDRLEPVRRDDARINAALRDDATLVSPVWRNRSFISAVKGQLVPLGLLRPLGGHIETHVLLGEIDQQLVFATVLAHDAPAVDETLSAHGQFADLREVAGTLDRLSAAWLAHGRAMAHWHHTHRFCGSCAAPTESRDAGHVLRCTNATCARQHFPRTDSAVIMLVEYQGRCLLGRNQGWTNNLYSTLAGFVEPGESLEDAVRREIAEESGVRVGAVHYHSSQPWPFPASIMLGFFADALDPTLRLDEREIADARWFSRSELVHAVQAEELRLPRGVSIARRLLEDWYAREGATLAADLSA